MNFYPSPDGSLVAINTRKEVLVVDAMGNIVAKAPHP